MDQQNREREEAPGEKPPLTVLTSQPGLSTSASHREEGGQIAGSNQHSSYSDQNFGLPIVPKLPLFGPPRKLFGLGAIIRIVSQEGATSDYYNEAPIPLFCYVAQKKRYLGAASKGGL